MFNAEQLKSSLNKALEFAAHQVRNLVERYPDFYPMYTSGGKWKHQGEAWTNWCEGFLPGMMWLIYERTGEAYFRQKAEEYSRRLEHRKDDRDVHDLGFIFYHGTYKRWYEATCREGKPDESLRQVVVHAGRTLAMRYQPAGRYLCSFIAPESLFIDIMMNVPIIFYAAEQTADPDLRRIAMDHCLTTRRYLVRGDGSTAHEGIFDLNTGEFLRQSTHQGYRSDSCWSRGLTWAIYGFATVYQHTNDARFLQTAQACADYYIAHTPADGVPPWDYDAPDEQRTQKDSSAAAVAAGAMLKLAKLSGHCTLRRLYRQYAMLILQTLCSDEYLAANTPGWEGILKHGVYHIHKGLGVDESVMWGEFFFLEAVCTALADLAESP